MSTHEARRHKFQKKPGTQEADRREHLSYKEASSIGYRTGQKPNTRTSNTNKDFDNVELPNNIFDRNKAQVPYNTPSPNESVMTNITVDDSRASDISMAESVYAARTPTPTSNRKSRTPIFYSPTSDVDNTKEGYTTDRTNKPMSPVGRSIMQSDSDSDPKRRQSHEPIRPNFNESPIIPDDDLPENNAFTDDVDDLYDKDVSSFDGEETAKTIQEMLTTPVQKRSSTTSNSSSTSRSDTPVNKPFKNPIKSANSATKPKQNEFTEPQSRKPPIARKTPVPSPSTPMPTKDTSAPKEKKQTSTKSKSKHYGSDDDDDETYQEPKSKKKTPTIPPPSKRPSITLRPKDHDVMDTSSNSDDQSTSDKIKVSSSQTNLSPKGSSGKKRSMPQNDQDDSEALQKKKKSKKNQKISKAQEERDAEEESPKQPRKKTTAKPSPRLPPSERNKKRDVRQDVFEEDMVERGGGFESPSLSPQESPTKSPSPPSPKKSRPAQDSPTSESPSPPPKAKKSTTKRSKQKSQEDELSQEDDEQQEEKVIFKGREFISRPINQHHGQKGDFKKYFKFEEKKDSDEDESQDEDPDYVPQVEKLENDDEIFDDNVAVKAAEVPPKLHKIHGVPYNIEKSLRYARVRPLQYWTNEFADLDEEVVLRPDIIDEGRKDPKKKKTKPKLTAGEEEVVKRRGKYQVYSQKADAEITRTIAKFPQNVPFKRFVDPDNNLDITLGVFLNTTNWKTGTMTIHPGCLKPESNTKEYSEVYHLTSGKVRLELGEQQIELSAGSTFFVPKQNNYQIINRSERKPAVLVYTFIKEDGDDERDETKDRNSSRSSSRMSNASGRSSISE